MCRALEWQQIHTWSFKHKRTFYFDSEKGIRKTCSCILGLLLVLLKLVMFFLMKNPVLPVWCLACFRLIVGQNEEHFGSGHFCNNKYHILGCLLFSPSLKLKITIWSRYCWRKIKYDWNRCLRYGKAILSIRPAYTNLPIPGTNCHKSIKQVLLYNILGLLMEQIHPEK